MKKPVSQVRSNNFNYPLIIGLILALLIPAYFFNLGTLRFIDDEAIRSLVALEMKLSGDYITPTMGGDFYFKKPPLFNWILLAAFSISGHYTELTPRLVNMIFLLIYCCTIFLVVKKRYGARKGFLSAVLFLTCGRVILYESLYGLIDMTFSWLIFSNFILIYYLFDHKKYLLLFLISYTITGITFLMKGLPPLAFQGVTLLVAAFSFKNFKVLLSWKHMLGCIPFFLITGAYYYAYHLRNPDQFSHLLHILFRESAEKSAVNYGITEVIKNMFTYSFEIVYNFIPGILIIIFFLKRNPLELLKQDPFLYYLARIFLFNIIIYLISPTTYMRYVLMLMPLVFIIFVIHYEYFKDSGIWQIKFIHIIILIAPILFFLVFPVFPFVEATGFVRFAWIKTLVLMATFIPIIYYLIKLKNLKLEFLVLTLLIVRIGFNMFIIPSRVHGHINTEAKRQVLEMALKTKDKPLYRYKTFMPLPNMFYATAARQEIIYRKTDLEEPGYYLVKDVPPGYKDLVFDSVMVKKDSILTVLNIK